MEAPVLLLILVFGSAGIVPWSYKVHHPAIAWLLAAAAFLVVIGVKPWREALLSLTSTATGLAVLTGVSVVGGGAFFFEVRRRRAPKPASAGPGARRPRRAKGRLEHHHYIRTPVIGMILATCAAVDLFSWTEVLAELGRAPAAIGTVVGDSSKQVAAIAGGHAPPMVPQHAGEVVAVGVGGLIALAVGLHHMVGKGRDARVAAASAQKGAQPKAIAGGQGSGFSRAQLPQGGGRQS